MDRLDKLEMRSPSLADANYETLARLLPNCASETVDESGAALRAIDADALAQEINTRVVSGHEELYQFTWPDKRKAVLLANAPIAALRPCREESVDFDNTGNPYIEGDNLDVLMLLRETYLIRVKMLYIEIIRSRLIQSNFASGRQFKRGEKPPEECKSKSSINTGISRKQI
ncbi:MAG: hypothetical protein LBS11_00185 [Oscillospiraceae bacterium]|jgi:adenine-specific DNA-methyltransferase|nr:hypothetical protein [Oscillospiraceae bacterium]